MISRSEICDPVGTTETVWLPFYKSHLYAAYETEDSQEVDIVNISDYYQIWLTLQTVVFVYPTRPEFLVDYPHTYDVVQIKVIKLQTH